MRVSQNRVDDLKRRLITLYRLRTIYFDLMASLLACTKLNWYACQLILYWCALLSPMIFPQKPVFQLMYIARSCKTHSNTLSERFLTNTGYFSQNLYIAMMDWLMMLFTKPYNGYIGLKMNLLDGLKEAEIWHQWFIELPNR